MNRRSFSSAFAGVACAVSLALSPTLAGAQVAQAYGTGSLNRMWTGFSNPTPGENATAAQQADLQVAADRLARVVRELTAEPVRAAEREIEAMADAGDSSEGAGDARSEFVEDFVQLGQAVVSRLRQKAAEDKTTRAATEALIRDVQRIHQKAAEELRIAALKKRFEETVIRDYQAEIREQMRLRDSLVEEALRLLEAHLRDVERANREFLADMQPKPHTPGELNLLPLWAEIPEPVPALPEAKMVNIEVRYGGFAKKIEMFQQQLSDQQQRNNKYVDIHQREGNAGLEARARAEADRNPLVQEMGGARAIQGMTKSQRKTAVKEAVAENPGLMVGSDVALASEAMMKRAASDPAYRARIDKMTPAQKTAEINEYLQSSGQSETTRNDAEFERVMAERRQAYDAAAVQRVINGTLIKMMQVAQHLTPPMQQCNEVYDEAYQLIETWYKQAYANLPLDKMHEKIGLSDLMKMRAILLYALHKEEAATRAVLWKLHKTGMTYALGEFDELVGSFGWGRADSGNLFRGTYEEPQVAAAVNSVYDQMIQFSNQAGEWTRINKSRQESYEFAMK